MAMNGMLLILIWSGLMGIVAVYVIYRLLTDKDHGGKRHVLYPLASRPSDPMFPDRTDFLGWSAYSLLLLGVFGFVVGLYLEISRGEVPEFLNAVTGAGLLGGIALTGIVRYRNRRKR